MTDQLRSYEAGLRTIMPSVQHNTERYANNRAEVSHEPIRQLSDNCEGSNPLLKRNGSGRCRESSIFSESDATCCGQPTTGCCEAVPSLFGIR